MASTTRSSVRYRCSQGKHGCAGYFRVSLAKLRVSPDVKCPHCGCDKVFKIDKWRLNDLAKQKKCNCAPIPFLHRKGSLRFCVHHKLAAVEPTEQELHEYEYLISTPRQGFM